MLIVHLATELAALHSSMLIVHLATELAAVHPSSLIVHLATKVAAVHPSSIASSFTVDLASWLAPSLSVHGPGLICELDGRTYCEQCHLSQFAYIPAEIIFNWNFKKRKGEVSGFFLFFFLLCSLTVLKSQTQDLMKDHPYFFLIFFFFFLTQTQLPLYMYTLNEPVAMDHKRPLLPGCYGGLERRVTVLFCSFLSK